MVALTAPSSYGGRADALTKPRSELGLLVNTSQKMYFKSNTKMSALVSQNTNCHSSESEFIVCIMILIANVGAEWSEDESILNLLYFSDVCIDQSCSNTWRCWYFLWSLTSVNADIPSEAGWTVSKERKLNSRYKLFPRVFNISVVYFNWVCAHKTCSIRLHYSRFPCLFSELLSVVISLHLFSSLSPQAESAGFGPQQRVTHRADKGHCWGKSPLLLNIAALTRQLYKFGEFPETNITIFRRSVLFDCTLKAANVCY